MIHRPPTPEIGTQLGNLYRSSHDLIDRFGLTPNVETAWEKFQEEIDELDMEIVIFGLDDDLDDLAAEAVDVLVTLFNVVRAAGVSEQQFICAIRDTWRKNDSKDSSTHSVVDGFIERKGK